MPATSICMCLREVVSPAAPYRPSAPVAAQHGSAYEAPSLLLINGKLKILTPRRRRAGTTRLGSLSSTAYLRLRQLRRWDRKGQFSYRQVKTAHSSNTPMSRLCGGDG